MRTSSMPTWRAIASAVVRLSPVSMIRCSIPRARRSPITRAASGRTVSATAIRPQTCRSLPITTTRSTGLLERRGAIDHLAGLLAAFHDVAVRAEPKVSPRNWPTTPFPENLHLFRRRDLDAARGAMLDDRLGERVRAAGLERRRARSAPVRCVRRTGRSRPPPVDPSSACRSCRTPWP